jgi:hypothetical protein
MDCLLFEMTSEDRSKIIHRLLGRLNDLGYPVPVEVMRRRLRRSGRRAWALARSTLG